MGTVAELVGNEGGVVSGFATSNHPTLERRTGDHAMTFAARPTKGSKKAKNGRVSIPKERNALRGYIISRGP
jgi:hypothetical protein